MAAMVFLKIAADISFLFFLLGPAAVRFGAGPWTCVITCALICVSHVISYLIEERNSHLRFLPYIIPFAGLALPGISISWAIVCGIIFAYAVFCAATRRYMPDEEYQKTVFKVTLCLTAAMLVILLLLSAKGISYRIVIFGSIISACCSILIMRSLRHDPEVYERPSFQVLNIVIIAAVILLSVLLSARTVLSGIFTVLKTVYTGIAYVALYLITAIIRAIAYLAAWISSLIGDRPQNAKEPETFVINPGNAEEMFGEKITGTGLPQWVKITGLVILILIALVILFLVFRRLAGARSAKTAAAGGESSDYPDAPKGSGRHRFSGQVQGVRKQYRKYLALIENAGGTIEPGETTMEISEHAPDGLACAAARELRELYLEARYNGVADRQAADRAKELVREIKRGRGSEN